MRMYVINQIENNNHVTMFVVLAWFTAQLHNNTHTLFNSTNIFYHKQLTTMIAV